MIGSMGSRSRSYPTMNHHEVDEEMMMNGETLRIDENNHHHIHHEDDEDRNAGEEVDPATEGEEDEATANRRGLQSNEEVDELDYDETNATGQIADDECIENNREHQATANSNSNSSNCLTESTNKILNRQRSTAAASPDADDRMLKPSPNNMIDRAVNEDEAAANSGEIDEGEEPVMDQDEDDQEILDELDEDDDELQQSLKTKSDSKSIQSQNFLLSQVNIITNIIIITYSKLLLMLIF